jgi:1,4-alpha-glucan branching enzyme
VVNRSTISVHQSIHPNMGANLFSDGCSFRLWAPNAILVSVCIWHDEQMSQVALAPEPSNSSYWSVDVADIVAGQSYQFSIVNKGGEPNNPGGILTRVDAYARQVESAEDNFSYRGDGAIYLPNSRSLRRRSSMRSSRNATRKFRQIPLLTPALN